ncbi:response regulator transcription factor [Flavobacterium sp. NRK F10]|uniref:DNA-binding response regulator n=1 Tax=Flavobacterium sediminis TaxID=2201181 RepID=A0A2U8QV54_9FLAO|nr:MULTISPECIES: response regulator transcription factor [Flavobacterium]AWM14077.1 DNA-binding response regulator [Flavobacterium sediminis]MCO6175272.1 response regulator transcription factor [Flavobacterium sp. NRK F10]
MIRVCTADNQPIVRYGLKTYFKENADIEVVAQASDLDELVNILEDKKIDVILLDIELSGISSIRDIKELLKEFPGSRIVLYTTVSEKMYAPTAVKAGVSAYVSKNASLKELENIIYKVKKGEVVVSEDVKKKIEVLSKGKKADRLFKKLSAREVEVLRYLNDGKKNKEIAEILKLDEKTISTYKLRLLAKLNVTNLVDLLNKAKTLDVI